MSFSQRCRVSILKALSSGFEAVVSVDGMWGQLSEVLTGILGPIYDTGACPFMERRPSKWPLSPHSSELNYTAVFPSSEG